MRLPRLLPLAAGAAGFLCAAALVAQDAEWVLGEDWEGWTLETFTTRDGLPQNSVNDILQTRDGYLWIATFGGLARFDGRSFDHFTLSSAPAIPETRAVSLLEDREGVLWVGFQEGHLVRKLREGFVEVPGTEGELGVVTDLAEDDSGRVWVTASEGAGVVPPGGSFRWLEGAPAGVGGRSVVTTDDGASVLFSDFVLRHFGRDGRLRDQVPLRTDSGAVHSLDSDGRGGLYVSSSIGLQHVVGDAVRLVSPRNVHQVVFDPSGSLWIVGDGVHILAADAARVLDPVILPDVFPFYVARFDREGGLWLGTRGRGLLRLRRSPLSWRPVLEEGRRRGAEATLSDAAGRTWAAACGSLQQVSPGATRVVARVRGTGECFKTAARAADGVAWFSTPVVRIEDGQAVVLSAPEGAGFLQLFSDSRGRVSAIRGGVYSRWGEGGWRVVDRIPLEPEETPTAPPVGRSSGEVWIPTAEGLVVWSNEGTRRLGPEDGLAQGGIRALVFDEEGDAWAGSYGGGLSRITSDGSVQTLTTADGLAENVVVGLVLDDTGRLWSSGNRYLSVFRLADLRRRLAGDRALVRTVRFGPEDGFREANGQLASIDREGRLWFPAIDGVLTVDPHGLWEGRASPGLVIESASADGRPLELGAPRIPSATRDLVFHYTTPRFDRPDNVQFRYRLRELDPEWTEAGTDRTALFSRLPPGRYTFEVEAIDTETGAVSRAAESLRVVPAVWQTWWFQGLAVLAGAGLILVLVRLRLRALHAHAAESASHARELQREIDERIRAEEESVGLREQLLRSQKLEAIGRLTGGIAHDFNNLLTVVLGHLELASSKSEVPPGLEPHLAAAHEAAERGSALTRQLLAFSRRADLEPAPTDVRALIAGMEPLLRSALGALTELKVEAGSDVTGCSVDSGRLENVILNLVINARDALEGGGVVTISLEGVELGERRAREWDLAPGSYLQLSVADTGTGIPAEILDRVLDPFFTTKEVGKGTGLGLSMAYGFARQSGGHLAIESEPSRGTAVHLFLPAGAAEASEAPIAAPAPDRASGERVLVVEDEPQVRGVTVQTLHGLGYRTAEAEDVAAARLALLQFPDVCAVLSDVVLPGESGIEFRDELRRTRPELAVVLVSGRPHRGDGEAGEEAEDILAKPFTRDLLHARLRRALEVRHPART